MYIQCCIYFTSLDLSYGEGDPNQSVSLNPAYANDLDCDLTGHPTISYEWECTACSAAGPRSTIPANSFQDGDEEIIFCTGAVKGEFNQFINVYNSDCDRFIFMIV